MRPVVDRNVVVRCIPVLRDIYFMKSTDSTLVVYESSHTTRTESSTDEFLYHLKVFWQLTPIKYRVFHDFRA